MLLQAALESVNTNGGERQLMKCGKGWWGRLHSKSSVTGIGDLLHLGRIRCDIGRWNEPMPKHSI